MKYLWIIIFVAPTAFAAGDTQGLKNALVKMSTQAEMVNTLAESSGDLRSACEILKKLDFVDIYAETLAVDDSEAGFDTAKEASDLECNIQRAQLACNKVLKESVRPICGDYDKPVEFKDRVSAIKAQVDRLLEAIPK